MAEKPRIAITMGDPCGIGPEIIAKALASGQIYPLCRPLVIGSADALEAGVKAGGVALAVRRVESAAGAGEDPRTADVLDMANFTADDLTVAQASAAGGKAQWEWMRKAQELLAGGQVQGLAMAPVNSQALKLSGVQASFAPSNPHMFNFNGPLRVVRLTDHTQYKDVPNEVKKDKIVPVLEMIHAAFRRWGFSSPRIAVAGLNPHAMGEEEEQEIAPAVKEAQQRGINAQGPFPPDSVFHQCAEGNFDVVLAMTHDQANIAQKTRRLEGTVSLADPDQIRTSVSHGTAYDIAGKGVASEESILNAIKLAAMMAGGTGFPA